MAGLEVTWDIVILTALVFNGAWLYAAVKGKLPPIASKRSLVVWLVVAVVLPVILETGLAPQDDWRRTVWHTAWVGFFWGAILRWVAGLAGRAEQTDSDGREG